ncbi:hypothetical protein ACWDLG_22710 [Nonomuraea sp. NPDC003727]
MRRATNANRQLSRGWLICRHVLDRATAGTFWSRCWPMGGFWPPSLGTRWTRSLSASIEPFIAAPPRPMVLFLFVEAGPQGEAVAGDVGSGRADVAVLGVGNAQGRRGHARGR